MARTGKGALLTDRHRRSQVSLAITADSQARRLWDSTLDPEHLESSQPTWKRTMLNLLETWYNISAQQALLYLPQFRQAETGDDGGIRVGVPRFDRLHVGDGMDWLGSTNVKWHLDMGKTQQEAWQAARSIFLGAFHEAVLTGGRRTIKQWAEHDTKAIGYRRVADGNPCTFCAMLVGRGPVYTSERRARQAQGGIGAYHPHCGCTTEVIYGDWKPNEQEQQWIDSYYDAAESLPKGTPRTADSVLPVMRRDGGFRDSPASRGSATALRARREDSWHTRIATESGTHMPANWPRGTAPLSDTVRSHILYGNPKEGTGGHLFGQGIEGKTEFPEGWDGDRIEHAIGRVMDQPEWTLSGKHERQLWRFGSTVDGVQIEVKAYKSEGVYIIDRAFPIGGDGVTKNTGNGRMPVKKSHGKNWRKVEND